jgi:hypothetical protein
VGCAPVDVAGKWSIGASIFATRGIERFVAVCVGTSTRRLNAKPRIVEVIAKSSVVAEKPRACTFVVRIGNDLNVQVPEGFDASHLVDVVSSLRKGCSSFSAE